MQVEGIFSLKHRKYDESIKKKRVHLESITNKSDAYLKKAKIHDVNKVIDKIVILLYNVNKSNDFISAIISVNIIIMFISFITFNSIVLYVHIGGICFKR